MDARQNILKIAGFKLLCAVALGGCILTAGCKSNGNAELLERELRFQEDRIYQLEGEIAQMCDVLDSARRENQALKKEVAGGDRGAGGQFAPTVTGPPVISTPSNSGGGTLAPPKLSLPPLDSSPDDLDTGDEAPHFQPSNPSTEPTLAPPYKKPLDPDEPPPIFKPSSGTSQLPALSGDSKKIARLALNRQLTGGWNPDKKHGDEGVFVAFEPRDATNKPVDAAGDISIVVLDTAQTGAAARVARWDFYSDEVGQYYRKGPFGNGFQFELPWPSNPPVSRDLRLFVRLTTIDGRKIESDAKIRVTPLELNGKDWNPAAPKEAEDVPPLIPSADAKPIQHSEPVVKAKEQSPTPARQATKPTNRRKVRAWSPNR